MNSTEEQNQSISKLRRMLIWIAAAFGLWIVLSVIPESWRPGIAGIGFMTGTLATGEKSKTGKVGISFLTTFYDWVGLALVVAVAAGVKNGADVVTIIKLLRGSK